MDVGTLSFILCAVFARFLRNLPHRMNVEALSFILCKAVQSAEQKVQKKLSPGGAMPPVTDCFEGDTTALGSKEGGTD